jgi:ADP-L-glycero-D-manno-heptose 6-epimerase
MMAVSLISPPVTPVVLIVAFFLRDASIGNGHGECEYFLNTIHRAEALPSLCARGEPSEPCGSIVSYPRPSLSRSISHMRDPGTVLVTGAAGLIGSAVVWALNQRGHDRIIAVDRLDRREKWRNLVPLRFDDYLEADALGDKIVRGLLNDVRTVIHLGACSSTTETDARYLVENNFEYTKMLAEWTLQHGIRFVYASSAATYGALEGRLSDRLDIQTLRPLNMYGYSKQLFDLHASRHGYLDRIVGLKYFNVFGPNEDHKGDMRSVVNKAFRQILETGRVKLFKSYRPEFADGEQRRDFLYVKDAVDMTLHLVDEPGANGLFNIGSGEPHTWRELVTAVFAALGRPAEIEFIDMPLELRGKYQYATEASLDRLHGTNYRRPITPLPDAVREYVTRYLVPDRHLGDERAADAG